MNLGRCTFPAGVIAEEVAPLPESAPLLPAEESMLSSAGARRQREFRAGRLCAHRALAWLGMGEVPLLNGPDRAPLWPRGVSGSISHTESYAIAVVGWSSAFPLLGVDAEPDEPVEPETWPLICTPRELRRVHAAPPAVQGRLVRLLFSAKECAYKAQYPHTRAFLDFRDVEIEPDLTADTFIARYLAPSVARIRDCEVAGRFVRGCGLLVTGIAEAQVPWGGT